MEEAPNRRFLPMEPVAEELVVGFRTSGTLQVGGRGLWRIGSQDLLLGNSRTTIYLTPSSGRESGLGRILRSPQSY